MTRRTVVGLAIVGATSTTPSRAQSVDQVATVPPNVVLSNYDNVPVGPFGGLEGSAYVARVGDPSAAWFNPAGLSRQTSVQISGSAFNGVDLSSWSVGVSGSVAKLQFAVGVNYRVGAASDVLVRNLLHGGPLLTKIDVHTGGLIYFLPYQF